MQSPLDVVVWRKYFLKDKKEECERGKKLNENLMFHVVFFGERFRSNTEIQYTLYTDSIWFWSLNIFLSLVINKEKSEHKKKSSFSFLPSTKDFL